VSRKYQFFDYFYLTICQWLNFWYFRLHKFTMETFSNIASNARVWVYGSNRKFTPSESMTIQDKLDNFTASWSSHDMPMKAEGAILFNQLIIIALDERVNSISGCGIDKSVQLMKDLGAMYQINFFDRLLIFTNMGLDLKAFDKKSLQAAIDAGEVSEDTLVLNPILKDLGDFNQNGFVPLSTFWMAPQLNFLVQP